MKYLLLAILVTTVSCGPRKKVVSNYENGFDNSQNESRLGNLEQRVSSLEAQVSLNISQIEMNGTAISDLQSQLSQEILDLQQEIYNLNTEITTVKAEIDSLEAFSSDAVQQAQAQLEDLQNQLTSTQDLLNQSIQQGTSAYYSIVNAINTLGNSNISLQNSVDTLLSQMTQLQTNQTVVAIVDPCPSVSSTDYKEMLLKLNSGVLVAYFEDGGKRFLTELKPGSYKTTDRRACNFTVNANNTITN